MRKNIKYILIGFIGGILNGLFGSGGGSIVVPSIEKFCDFESKRAHATAIAVILIMTIVSSILYVSRGYFDINSCWTSLIGGILGGITGGILLKKISVKWLKITFGFIIMATAIKIVL